MHNIDSLKNILKGKVCIVCVGNIERGDDGIGPRLAERIRAKVPYEVIDTGTAPENYTGVIARLKPDTIIIIDAIYFDGKPGEIKLFSAEDLHCGKVSTHDISLKLLAKYLKESSKAHVHILGIKPMSNKLGEGLSPRVKASIDNLSRIFIS